MAFSTIQGSGGAPDSFVGTSGVDAIVIVNSDGNYFLGAEEANDVISLQSTTNPLYGGVVSNTTLKGGQGADSFAFAGAATTYVSSWVNGNADRDTITTSEFDQFFSSTIHGGAANDTIRVSSALNVSLVNGNKGVDNITVTGGLTTSSIFGGGGNDIIFVELLGTPPTALRAVDSVISGDLGNDTITAGSVGSADGSSIFGGQGVDIIDATAFGDVGDTIVINGNDDGDIITGSDSADQSIFGGSGNDRINTGTPAPIAIGTSTITGGDGADAIYIAGASIVNYTAIGQGGASGSATSTSTAASGDTITNFQSGGDDINFASAALSGVALAAVTGQAGTWNLDNAGVFISTQTATPITSYASLAAAIGTVSGDAGDTGYFAFISNITVVNPITTYTIAQVTLGTNKDGTQVGGALNGADQIAVLGTVATPSGSLAAGDFSFLG